MRSVAGCSWSSPPAAWSAPSTRRWARRARAAAGNVRQPKAPPEAPPSGATYMRKPLCDPSQFGYRAWAARSCRGSTVVDAGSVTFGYYTAALVAIAGIALASGTQFAVIGLWRRREAVYLSYAM